MPLTQATHSAPVDPLARAGAGFLALGRIGLGVGIVAFTRPALRALGFPEPDGSSLTLARLAGGRDIAMGIHGWISRDDPGELRRSVLLGAAVDAGDALAFSAALAGREGIDRTALINAPLAASAAAMGGLMARRLRRAPRA